MSTHTCSVQCSDQAHVFSSMLWTSTHVQFHALIKRMCSVSCSDQHMCSVPCSDQAHTLSPMLWSITRAHLELIRPEGRSTCRMWTKSSVVFRIYILWYNGSYKVVESFCQIIDGGRYLGYDGSKLVVFFGNSDGATDVPRENSPIWYGLILYLDFVCWCS